MSQSTTTSISREFDQFYENRCRTRIPGILWNFFQIGVCTPYERVNRKFKRSEFPNWPLDTSNDAEIDYWAHTSVAVPSITFQDGATHGSVPDVTLYSSAPSLLGDEETTIQQVPNMSPEKGEGNSSVPPSGFQYILGEITNGGETSSVKKIRQLEKDCHIVLAKSGGDNILKAVALGLIIANRDFHCKVFQKIESLDPSNPVKKLYCAGRIVFVHDNNTTSAYMQNLAELQAEANSKIEETRSTIEETNSKVDELNVQMVAVTGQIEETRSTIEETNAKVDELNVQMVAVTGQIEETRSTIEKTNAKVDELNVQMVAVTGQIEETIEKTNSKVDELNVQMTELKILIQELLRRQN
jgi:hypothetical protein